MFSSGQLWIEADELRSILIDLFDEKDQRLMDRIDYDLRTSAFLHRDSNGRFYFAHKSFMEFFAAKWIFSSLHSQNPGILEYISDAEEYAFSPEIDDFLRQMIAKTTDTEFLEYLQRNNPKGSNHAKRLLTLLTTEAGSD